MKTADAPFVNSKGGSPAAEQDGAPARTGQRRGRPGQSEFARVLQATGKTATPPAKAPTEAYQAMTEAAEPVHAEQLLPVVHAHQREHAVQAVQAEQAEQAVQAVQAVHAEQAVQAVQAVHAVHAEHARQVLPAAHAEHALPVVHAERTLPAVERAPRALHATPATPAVVAGRPASAAAPVAPSPSAAAPVLNAATVPAAAPPTHVGRSAVLPVTSRPAVAEVAVQSRAVEGHARSEQPARPAAPVVHTAPSGKPEAPSARPTATTPGNSDRRPPAPAATENPGTAPRSRAPADRQPVPAPEAAPAAQLPRPTQLTPAPARPSANEAPAPSKTVRPAVAQPTAQRAPNQGPQPTASAQAPPAPAAPAPTTSAAVRPSRGAPSQVPSPRASVERDRVRGARIEDGAGAQDRPPLTPTLSLLARGGGEKSADVVRVSVADPGAAATDPRPAPATPVARPRVPARAEAAPAAPAAPAVVATAAPTRPAVVAARKVAGPGEQPAAEQTARPRSAPLAVSTSVPASDPEAPAPAPPRSSQQPAAVRASDDSGARRALVPDLQLQIALSAQPPPVLAHAHAPVTAPSISPQLHAAAESPGARAAVHAEHLLMRAATPGPAPLALDAEPPEGKRARDGERAERPLPATAAPAPDASLLPPSASSASPLPVDPGASFVAATAPSLPAAAAPLIDHVAADPGLQVAVMQHAAHVTIAGDDGRALELHVRLSPEGADIRASGTLAPMVQARVNELTMALASQGLTLGNFELTGQHAHDDRADTADREASDASDDPAAARRGPRAVSASNGSGATNLAGRIHVKA